MVKPNQSMKNYQNYSHLNGKMSTAFSTSGPSGLAKIEISQNSDLFGEPLVFFLKVLR